MIELTRLNKEKFILNCELIETIETKPDTVVTLRNGKLHIVQEAPSEIVSATIDYKQRLYKGLISRADLEQGDAQE